MIVIEVVEPYSREALNSLGVEPATVEEYAFCLGWQDGAEWHIVAVQPVSGDQVDHYTKGWALGAWNRMQWLRQGIDQMTKHEYTESTAAPEGSPDN